MKSNKYSSKMEKIYNIWYDVYVVTGAYKKNHRKITQQPYLILVHVSIKSCLTFMNHFHISAVWKSRLCIRYYRSIWTLPFSCFGFLIKLLSQKKHIIYTFLNMYSKIWRTSNVMVCYRTLTFTHQYLLSCNHVNHFNNKNW